MKQFAFVTTWCLCTVNAAWEMLMFLGVLDAITPSLNLTHALLWSIMGMTAVILWNMEPQ